MNNADILKRMAGIEKALNKCGFFKIREDIDSTKQPPVPWCVLFVRYEQYCYDVNTTLEKLNRKYHNRLIKRKDGIVSFPKKATENPYCFIYMDLNEITVYDVLPESELATLFSGLSNHKPAGVPSIHKFTPAEFQELSTLIIDYQELLDELSNAH